MAHPLDMRKAIYRADDALAWRLLEEAHVVHLASTTDTGEPVLRALHAAAYGGALFFHGAPAGEKTACLGRRAVASAERVIASIPSYFLDPERACPATTYYAAAQAHGALEEVRAPEEKAEALAALMRKHQPEGRHAPLDASSPLYRKAIAGLLVFSLRPDRVDGKLKIGQNRSPTERARVLDCLWTRGDPGDARAAAEIVRLAPEIPEPAFLRRARGAWRAGDGARVVPALVASDLDEVAALLRGAYWLEGETDDVVRASFARSAATVGVRSAGGALLGAARATSDGRCAWIYDVIVDARARGRGIAAAMLRLLLEHPDVRGARTVRLGTRDADGLYRRFGFVDVATRRRYPVVEMVRALDVQAQNVAAVASPA